ncbi:ferrous iron transport protein B [Desulfuribacillus stibiiarsenatis]|uniref:Ferrous iron transport protein B n=1 Tax=Desulfuribacillus stibiiarsenatis TaxID=1390249 RepID=A0A1E5L540_9FIRM|nr:ferrous iron transport protein B [Desulfuribacillus stibiiarsenatis]OEH85231.1 ferrous iron transport protein B [Desulfuribacillus stibiiarsenatis]
MSFTTALTGNPNVGKSALFNKLTGARQHVANWPGVTVEKRIGSLNKSNNQGSVKIVDLPGIYSLTSYSIEEIVTRSYLSDDEPDVIINVIDASNLERNLYLTLQLIELNKPLVIALNMMDVAKKRGMLIDIQKLSDLLGVPVIPIVAVKQMGIQELMNQTIAVAEKQQINAGEATLRIYDQSIENILGNIMRLLKRDSSNCDIKEERLRWTALRLLEGDQIILQTIKTNVSDSSFIQELEEIVHDSPFISRIIENRYEMITQIKQKVVEHKKECQLTITDTIDKILINRVLGIPIFLLIMWGVFLITFDILGTPLVDWVDSLFVTLLIPSVNQWLTALEVSSVLNSMISEGIIGGVGSVIVFVPQIFILYFFISLIEDSGYMARAAFIMDRLMRKIGLNGKAFIPMILGFGCSVPAVMAARTLEDENDRKVTMLVTPLMSCSARLPVYLIFVTVFFPHNSSAVVFSLYLLGILVAIGLGYILKKTILKGEYVPFILELPPYRIPEPTTIMLRVWERGKLFLIKAGTIIFGMSVIMWVLLHFSFNGVSEIDDSFLASIGKVISPIFAPLGFDNWQATVAIFAGFMAKEVVVSTMAIIYGLGDMDIASQSTYFHQFINNSFTALSAYSFMVFVLLYTPCIATLATIKRESGSYRWTFLAMVGQFMLAWTVAALIYQIGSLFF